MNDYGLPLGDRLAIEARELRHWTVNQLRAEIGRRMAKGVLSAADAYWVDRLRAELVVQEAIRVVRGTNPRPGLRVISPRRNPDALWPGFQVLHRASGQVVIGGFRRRHHAEVAACRLAEAADWRVPWEELGPEHHAAVLAEKDRWGK